MQDEMCGIAPSRRPGRPETGIEAREDEQQGRTLRQNFFFEEALKTFRFED